MIRVGRCIYDSKGKVSYPSYPGFTNVIVMMKSHSRYWKLSPYYLKDRDGNIMENTWQFSKVYADVPKTTQKLSRWSPKVIWDYPAEKHFIPDPTNPQHFAKGRICPEYWNWRQKGTEAPSAIRYPVGYHSRHQCLFAAVTNPDGTVTYPLDYIESRKSIYLPLYCRLARKEKQFAELKARLKAGENLLIIEVDGPHQESLPYYKSNYGVGADFIVNNTILANKANLNIMLNDEKHPFGHGYCLASAMLDLDL